jgi:YVTN family beta-propeller protein
MSVSRRLMRRAVLSGAFALITSVAAAQTRPLTLVVVNRDENSVVFLDPATGKILGRVAVGEQPHGLAVSDYVKLAFVTKNVTTRKNGARHPVA